mmetsp:Transcript_23823/g.34808  ORF Transcript_23823/g.34808 Transcript_23823/m.34808 type:complete len:206 (+) Transcript_23823:72-689(+)|eukprot:CAMPEP_0195528146 /NCGR_PEP_ID=MMETSP0794_2-20130614/30183_1 /TAXON_ID=515487 /ORGANISM="Stephanopyxis turris, Strain CCMP 815" /LENGTH=205 /DNA_ID=CAMNT_0040659223 /DNA_START=67 /DNA_END=684 /DNA_ORIENTATION=-
MYYSGIFIRAATLSVLALACVHGTSAFCTSNNAARVLTRNASHLSMVPRYDPFTGVWEPMTEDDKPSAGYGPLGSLIRSGPLPFIQRIINPDSYEQGVLKYMANEGVDRMEAQGNMDAYMENPNDWAYQKLEEKRGKVPKKNYANNNTSPKQLILSGIWACIVFYFLNDLISGISGGRFAVDGEVSEQVMIGLQRVLDGGNWKIN